MTPDSRLTARAPALHSGVRLAELIGALSLAVDLGVGAPMEHALRSCLLALQLGEELGLDRDTLAETYYVTMLKFVGCTSDSILSAAIFGDEIEIGKYFGPVDRGKPSEFLMTMIRHVGDGEPPIRRARRFATLLSNLASFPRMAAAHCEAAQALAIQLGLGEPIVAALGQINELWNGRGGPNRLKGDELRISVRIMTLAQDADALCRMGGPEAVVSVVRERAGRTYDPAICDVFARRAPALLTDLDQEPIWEAVMNAEPTPWPRASGVALEEAFGAMANFTDLKSPYTRGHSTGVSQLAAAAAVRYRLPSADVDTVRWAGLVHDLGRVGVTNSIWDKKGALSAGEWERVRLHPYYTERILARSPALTPLGSLACLHHERLDGSGYHRCLPATMLSPAARLLATADAYQAMTEDRPHRPAMRAEQAAGELRSEVRAGRLDPEAVSAVLTAAGHRVRPARSTRVAGLSERETEVVRLVARGLSNKEMARELTISAKTVDHHIQHIYNKLGVSTRPAVALFAMQQGLLHETVPAAP